MLTSLGLAPHTEAVYRALLVHPDHGVAALAARLDLSEAEVRSALDDLSELALVRPAHGAPGRLHAISPDVGMEILLARQQADLLAQQQRVAASQAAAAQLISEFADLRPAVGQPGVEQLIGLDAIRDRIAVLQRDMREEVMILAPDGEQTKENLEAARPLDQALLARGVRMRTVYLDSVRNSPHTLAYAQWLSELGREARTAPTLPLRMIIADRSTAIIPVNSDDSAAGAVVLTGHGTLTALCALFESIWAGAKPFGEAPTRTTEGLTDTELTTLRLLAEGHTDEAIAKRLGVSHRTARRVATTLMERLDARSRFQAGVKAAHHGWL
ncbi:LuxR C-terminal-related transcriptional regulator (plasmid) [Streptomyces sp. BI20]|uniref:LuxR C-terminal-related transcriptional regulator n=1 Tax=Streptomyces sp. BI20 TaxID=3403460 RepID=UPI003C782F43